MTLTILPTLELSTELADLIKIADEYEKASLAPNTRRTYASMWKKFNSWCQSQNLSSMPAYVETIKIYLSSLGGKVSFSTIDCIIAAIEKAHEHTGMGIVGDPSVYKRVRKGMRRIHTDTQTLKQAKALSLVDLTLACRAFGNSLKALRDKALITLAFFGALRRSEVVVLDVEHIQFTEKGLILTFFQTKTSDEALRIYLTSTKDPSICPIRALKNWLLVSGICTGPIFQSLIKGNKLSFKRLTGRSVAKMMNNYFGKEYSGHSLRRGLVTAAAEKGTPMHKIQRLSRHKTANMVLKYIEQVEGFENSSSIALNA